MDRTRDRRHSIPIHHPTIGVCGLSCRLCPSYHARGVSRCEGCKSPGRMAVGCPMITCAVKKRGIEFCWECEQAATCDRWGGHRNFSRTRDTFVCYQKLEANIAFIRANGAIAFEQAQRVRERVLCDMLEDFNEGRSKTYYSIAATVLDLSDLLEVLSQARRNSAGLTLPQRSQLLHSLLDSIAASHGAVLRLRK